MKRTKLHCLTRFERKIQRTRVWLFSFSDEKVFGAALIFMVCAEFFFKRMVMP